MTDSILERDVRSPAADDELVWGAEAIGRVIGRSARAVFHMAATNQIPVKKIRAPGKKRGGRLCARKSSLLAIADV